MKVYPPLNLPKLPLETFNKSEYLYNLKKIYRTNYIIIKFRRGTGCYTISTPSSDGFIQVEE